MWFSTKDKVIALSSECKRLILANSLYQGGRLFVGAIGALYCLSFGLQVSDYAWLKTIQSIVFIVFDVPLGYLLNRIGEYKSLLLSLIFGILGVIGYLILTSFWGFIISEIFLALSLSIWPVAFSAYSMRELENYKTQGIVERFFHCGDAVTTLFIAICGSLGGLLYGINKYTPYGCFLLFYILTIIFTGFYLKNYTSTNTKVRGILNFNIPLTNFREIRALLPYAPILFLTQFLMQPIFHYWQPLFKEKFIVDSTDISIIFISYSVVMSLMSWGYSHMTHFAILRSNFFIIGVGTIGGVFYTLISRLSNFVPSLALFALSFGIFNSVQIGGRVLIQKNLKKENRMIVTKFISFYSRIGMIISLIILHLLFVNEWKVNEIYKLYGIMASLIFGLYLVYMIIGNIQNMDSSFSTKLQLKQHKFEKNYEQQENVITLRKFTDADIDDFMQWATDHEVTKYMMWDTYTSRLDAEKFFSDVVEKHPWFKAICLGDKVIGSITLDQGKGIYSCKAELGYVIARRYWDKGFVTQAVKLAIQTGFKDLNIERIEAYVDPINVGSQRVLEKNEFIKEGLLSKYILQKGLVKDRYIYALLRPNN